MGQESSTLAQQSINISAGESRVASTHEMQTPNVTSSATDHRYTGSMQRDRSRSPGTRIKFPLPQKQHAHSSDSRIRPRSPPLVSEHNTGRFSSPGSTRHRFVRENVEERHMAERPSPQSPNARFGSRDDAVRQYSPVSRRYSDNHTNWTRNAGSPNTPCERAAYRPDYHTSDRTRSVGGKIDFNGLQDVPTGPRRSISGLDAPNKDGSIQHPCIFISLRYIPNLPNLIKHLNGMLGELRPKRMFIDDSGWNLIFDDSPAGHARLTRCYEKFHMQLFFSEYELRMQCYPDGRPPRLQQEMEFHRSGRVAGSSGPHSPVQRPYKTLPPTLVGFEGCQVTHPEPVRRSLETGDAVLPSTSGETKFLAETPSHALPRNLFSNPLGATRTQEHTPVGINTSLLSVRSDRDETGSLASGATPSDSSRVKCNKCHRCSGDAAPGPSILVRCTTCPRQYHRRCHQDPVIPAHLAENHTWSCARCVKKGKTAKEIPKRDSSKPSTTLDPSATEAGSLLGHVVDNAQRGHSNGHEPSEKEVDDASNAQVEALRSDSKSPQNEGEPHADATPHVKPNTVVGDPLFSDAEDLVAKSFAAAEAHSYSKVIPQKPGKLKITRTKLPPKTPDAAAQQPQSEELIQDTTSSSNPPAIHPTNRVNTNEAVARNSVADLRALAHERHQTAIRNGTQGQLVSEEQRIGHTASSDLARSSSAQQSSNEIRPLQHPEEAKSSFTAPTILKHIAEREIPESPDEVRRGGSNNGTMTGDPRLLARLNSAISQRPAERTSDASLVQIEKPPALKGPKAPSAEGRCEVCQKRIPQGPSGRNKLCSGCKKDAAAAVAAAAKGAMDAKGTPETLATPVYTSFAPVANMVAGPPKCSDPENLGAHSFKTAAVDQQQETVPEFSDQRAQVDDAAVEPPVKAANSGEPKPKTTKSYGDSDTQMQKPSPQESTGNDVILNPLATLILGDLQFSSTVQMQLREDPSMSEFKMQQLKGILTEDETARTDDKVLAAKLQYALTNIKKGSLPPDQVVDSPDTAAAGHTAPIEVESTGLGASNSRLNFIKSVVGDSHDRPKGSRLILVAMALGSNSAHRMQARDIMEWIYTTVPTYTRGEGNWASRISAQLSQGRLTDSGGGYWREEEWKQGDGGKPNSRWYQLLPEKEDEMWTWCPVLKEPLSPQSRRDAKARRTAQGRAAKPMEHASAPRQVPAAASTSVPVTPMSGTNKAMSIYCGSAVLGNGGRRIDAASAKTAADDSMEIDEVMTEKIAKPLHGQKRKQRSSLNSSNMSTPEKQESSSEDDEPLSARAKRRRGNTLPQDPISRLHMGEQHISANEEVEDQLDLGADTTATRTAARQNSMDGITGNTNNVSGKSVDHTKPGMVTLNLKRAAQPPTAETFNCDFLANRESLATSVYDEWPEYRQPAFDEHDQLVEIRKRPKKKQFFGRPASNARLQTQQTLTGPATIPSNASPMKRSRTMLDPTPGNPWPWENPNSDPTRDEYKSLEEFFDFPDNMIPIISEGQLAYRDGTRTDDGRLPRAREIFKP